jgi:2'-5' RNA ligase
MHLFAALVLPREMLDLVTQLAAGVQPAPELGPPAEPGPGGRHLASAGRRFGRRRDPEPAPAEPTGPLLDLLPPVQMHLPLVKFGNLALTEATRLSDTLEAEAATWASPRLHLHGGVALEPEGDRSVWAGLEGDLDELKAVARGVNEVSQGLQLFVDRRAFRPFVRLGTINDRTTEAYLEALLAALESFESPSWWQTTVSLLIPADFGPDKPPYRVHRDIRLGPAVAH